MTTCESEKVTPDVKVEFSEISITENTGGLVPLSASVSFTTNTPTRITFSILSGSSPLRKEFSEFNTEHEIPILGLYPDQLNQVIIEVQNESGTSEREVVEIQTDPLPEFMPNISIIQKNPSQMGDGWNIIMQIVGLGAPNLVTIPTMFDHDGNVRWYLDLREINEIFPVGPVEPLRNGNLLFAVNNTVFEYDMMGFEKNTWSMPTNYFYHHEMVEKPDGNFIVAVYDLNSSKIEDIAIKIDRNTSELVSRWDLREILDNGTTS